MTPRGHDGQRVGRWRVQVDADGRLRQGEDGFANVVHAFYLGAPAPRLRILVEGEAEVADTAGVVAGAAERFPPEVFLRDTPLTAPAGGVPALAERARAGDGDLDRLHRLMAAIREDMVFEPGATQSATPAADALALGRGVCQDMTHVFLAAARALGVPARYVSGHLVRDAGDPEQAAGHAWAEAFVPGLGWVGFDVANGVCPTERHLRVAIGLDYLSAAPVRGSRRSGGGEKMEVRLQVSDAAQRQSQA